MTIAKLPDSPTGSPTLIHGDIPDKINEVIDGLEKESAIFDRGYGAGSVNFGTPVFEIAVNEQFNDSAGIVKVSATKVTLKAGSKYKVQAFLNCESTFASGYVDLQLFDATNVAFIGIKGTLILSANGGNSGSVVQPLAYVQAAIDTDIELQFAGGDDVVNYYAAVVIQKV